MGTVLQLYLGTVQPCCLLKHNIGRNYNTDRYTRTGASKKHYIEGVCGFGYGSGSVRIRNLYFPGFGSGSEKQIEK